ncbi:lipoyl synthase [candidate division KSB1 bacterium]|nr:lipoyl synthase [candidate division KSB1 bacterium]
MILKQNRYKRRPHWLKRKLPAGENYTEISRLLKDQNLHTVCKSAHCPNVGDCWARRTATFMILGDSCTRNCLFCAIDHGHVHSLDAEEPLRVARAVKQLDLSYAVITSVTRDDLPDGGALQFARTIEQIRELQPRCRIEVLIPDLQGDPRALDIIFKSHPDVLNHNLETVERLYEKVRPQANFERSLKVIHLAKSAGLTTKSGMMLGIGEKDDEIIKAIQSLLNAGCDILTLGQYLQPSKDQVEVDRFVPPEQFDRLKKMGLELGFRHVESGPFVRSSYHADEQLLPDADSAVQQK